MQFRQARLTLAVRRTSALPPAAALAWRFQPRDVAQRPYARQKEISASAHGDELRHATNSFGNPGSLWQAKLNCRLVEGRRFAVPEQRVGFAVKPVELAADNPSVLDEFELARNIGIKGKEIESARKSRLLAFQCIFAVDLRAIGAPAPDDPVKPARGEQVFARSALCEPERLQKPG